MSQKVIALINSIMCLLFVIVVWLASSLAPETGDITGAPSLSTGSVEEELKEKWAYFLINNENPLPEDYEPELKTVGGSFSLDNRCAGYAAEMLKSAELDGIRLCVVSAYRSRQKQGENFDNYVERLIKENYSEDEAAAITASQIALPGASEHNAGLALDILSADWFMTHDDITDDFDRTPEFAWLSKNSWKFGFILRYPKHGGDITGFVYEPWHFRYIGQEKAGQIYNSGLILEEYMDIYPQ